MPLREDFRLSARHGYAVCAAHGVWRSLVARFVRDEEVVGSNPATPTIQWPPSQMAATSRWNHATRPGGFDSTPFECGYFVVTLRPRSSPHRPAGARVRREVSGGSERPSAASWAFTTGASRGSAAMPPAGRVLPPAEPPAAGVRVRERRSSLLSPGAVASSRCSLVVCAVPGAHRRLRRVPDRWRARNALAVLRRDGFQWPPGAVGCGRRPPRRVPGRSARSALA